MHVPWQLSSHAIGELAAAWSAVEPDALWTLELPPAELYGPRDRVIDLVRRGLALWRAGARPAVIDAPWRAAPGTTHTSSRAPSGWAVTLMSEGMPDTVCRSTE